MSKFGFKTGSEAEGKRKKDDDQNSNNGKQLKYLVYSRTAYGIIISFC